MNKDFDKYYQAYLQKYSATTFPKEIKKNETEVNGSNLLLFIPFVFIIVLSFLINTNTNTNTNYNSKEINLLYSEKYINENLYIDPKLSVKVENNKSTFIKPNAIHEKETKKIVKQFQNIENYELGVVSDNRINNTKSNEIASLPSIDWKKGFSDKKIKFIETLLPLITFQNQQILIERKRLFRIKDYLKANKTLKNNDIIYLNKLAKKYKIHSKNKHKVDLVNELLQSADIIPNSIVLAQAANESGWGTSRFAKEFNALFGQYTYDENNGVIPYKRDKGKKHLIQYFSSIDKSVESYFLNINSHHAYAKFRKIRSQMNINTFNVKLLTETLDVYAEDKSYVDTINLIIDTNKFIQFDNFDSIFTKS